MDYKQKFIEYYQANIHREGADRLLAARPAHAVHEQRRALVGHLARDGADLLQRHVHRTGNMAASVFPRRAHVDQPRAGRRAELLHAGVDIGRFQKIHQSHRCILLVKLFLLAVAYDTLRSRLFARTLDH